MVEAYALECHPIDFSWLVGFFYLEVIWRLCFRIFLYCGISPLWPGRGYLRRLGGLGRRPRGGDCLGGLGHCPQGGGRLGGLWVAQESNLYELRPDESCSGCPWIFLESNFSFPLSCLPYSIVVPCALLSQRNLHVYNHILSHWQSLMICHM